jgi:hypothetical protein
MANIHVETCDFALKLSARRHTSMKTSLTRSLGQPAVVGEAQDKAVNPHTVPRVKHLHRVLVTSGNGADQSFV